MSTTSRPILGSTLVNTGWLVGDSIIRMGVNLFVGIWVARYLGPGSFGLLSYATAFVSLFSALSTLGLDRVVVREVVAGRLEESRILGTSFALKLAGGFAILILATTTSYLLNRGESLPLILVAICAAGTIAQALDVVDYYFQAMIQSKYATIARAAAFHTLSIVKVSLILLKAPLLAFALAGLAEILLASIFLWVMYKRRVHTANRWSWDFCSAKELLRGSWPLMLAGVMIMIYMRIDQVMLKHLSTAEEMGKYAGAVRLSEVWYFVLMAMSASIFPKLVSASAQSESEFNSLITRFYAATILVCYAFAVPLSLLSRFLTARLFGAEFQGMESMLFICAWAGLFVGIGLARGAYLTSKNLNKFQFYSTAAGALLNIGLNFLLIPRYGGRGAAFATLFSYAVAGYVSSFFYAPARKQGWIITKLLLPWNAWRTFDWQQFVHSLNAIRGQTKDYSL